MKKEALQVIKIGGNVLENTIARDAFLEAFAGFPGHKILVHGGGKLATQVAGQFGYITTMIEGRRVTDTNMLNVVIMTYAGLVNKQLVSKLQSLDTNAIGLTGADGNLILSQKRPVKNGLDFGWVGDPVQVNTGFLQKLLEMGAPVIAPLTHDADGNMLNTNADTIASELAKALADTFEVSLVYCFEQNGVLRDLTQPDSVIPVITASDFETAKADGTIHSGMVPKIENALKAVQAGVKEVRIFHHRDLTNLSKKEPHHGTIIR